MKQEIIYNKCGEVSYVKFSTPSYTTYYVHSRNVSAFLDPQMSRLQFDLADFVVYDGRILKNRHGTTDDLVEAFITLNYYD